MIQSKNVLIVALSPVGDGLSGGDRIFIEFARNLSKSRNVSILSWKDGIEMCRRNGLDENNVTFININFPDFLKRNFLVCYLARIVIGIGWALFAKRFIDTALIYSASEFIMDVYPSVILRMKTKRSKLVCAWFQTAPNPFKGYTEGKREKKYRLSALLYWLSQKLSKSAISHFSDYVLINNDDERKRFPSFNKKNKLLVVLGGVDIERMNEWRLKHKSVKNVYDGVFQGRFHPQKGVEELIEIWRIVVAKIPMARLAMIGDGPLMNSVVNKIKKYNLEKNIKLFGYVFDGNEKYSIFSSSKVVLHPAFYDSGGMASAEAMIFGLPIVGFDLVSYKSYYPKGMVKAKNGDLQDFASKTLDLLRDEKQRKRIGLDGQQFVIENLSWTKKTAEIFDNL